MLRCKAILMSCALMGFLFVAHPLRAQDAGQDEMMQKMMDFGTPGENHALLAKRAGKWNLTVKMWMDPAGPPSESPATSVQSMIMGGRYLLDETTGTFQGMEFRGRGTMGYDNGIKKFVSTWIDNMGTGIYFGEGEFDAAQKTFHFTNRGTDPMTGKTVTSRATERWFSDDHYVMESFRTGPDGKEHKDMEIEYKRSK